MTELPRIVRERLKAQASGRVDVHPDADLLTAFCERTLTENERQQVIAHLALCADCRDAVTLAAPPLLTETETAHAHREPRRFGWVHWFALAASIVVVATAVLQLSPDKQQGTEFARVASDSAPATKTQASAEPKPAEGAAVSTTEGDGSTLARNAAAPPAKRDETMSQVAAQNDFGETKKQAAPSQPMGNLGRAGVGGESRAVAGVVGGTRTGAFGAGQQANQPVAASTERERRDAPAAPPPPATRSNEVAAVEESRRPADALKSKDAEFAKLESSSGAGRPERQVAAADADSAAGSKETAGPTADKQVLDQNARKQAPASAPIEVQAETSTLQTAPATTKSKTSGFAALTGKFKAPLRWTVSALGKVQRSFDGGKNWQDLTIAEGIRFRAVAAQDGSVWAGGEGGALFYSYDAGENWMARPLSGDSKRLEMTPGFDILQIDITAAGQVTVTTSQRQTFVSTDAGRTWKRK